MSDSKLIHLSYFDPKAEVRLTAYADTIIMEPDLKGGRTLTAIRFGGYPESVQAMSDAIYGGGTIEARWSDQTMMLRSIAKGYRRQQTHDGVYAVATLMANDDAQEANALEEQDDADDAETRQPRKCYMKNNYSLAQRNQIVEEHLSCIDIVMRENTPLIKAAHLDRDDVYQQLALRLIRAVETFDPEKGKLEQHIFAQLRYELRNCKTPYRTTGITGAPADYRASNIISIDDVRECYLACMEPVAA